MDLRFAVAALILAGFAMTAVNGVQAYRSAKRRLTAFGTRVHRRHHPDGGSPPATQPAGLSDSEADRVVHEVLHALQASRTSLLLAGLGLLLTTVASIWSLFL